MFDGHKIRQLRSEMNLSLKELAEKSTVSISMISQIERGNTDPTLTTLYKICNGLDISISTLLGTDKDTAQVIRRDERKTISFPTSQSKYELLTPINEGAVEMIMIHLEPGQEDKSLVEHSGEEAGIVMEGEVTVILNHEEILLQQGDSIRFKSSIPHRLVNHSNKTSVSLWAMTGRVL